MTVFRSRRNEKLYRKYLATKTPGCAFCPVEKGDDQYVTETKSFKIIRNRFPYAFWDQQTVADHLMIVPKKHADSLASLTPDEAAEFLKIISEYEQNGYHIYARGKDSEARTITHQHTHLIKGKGKPKNIAIQVVKPHFLFSR